MLPELVRDIGKDRRFRATGGTNRVVARMLCDGSIQKVVE
jgi:hypothetical protein